MHIYGHRHVRALGVSILAASWEQTPVKSCEESRISSPFFGEAGARLAAAGCPAGGNALQGDGAAGTDAKAQS